MQEKIQKKSFCFLDNWIWISCGKSFLLGIEYLSWAINALKNSPKISNITKRDIFYSISFRVKKNMIKALSCRFGQCLGPFKVLTVKACSKTGFVRHLIHHVFHRYISDASHLFFSKYSKFDINFRNAEKLV